MTSWVVKETQNLRSHIALLNVKTKTLASFTALVISNHLLKNRPTFERYDKIKYGVNS